MFRKIALSPTIQFLKYASTSKTTSCRNCIKPIYLCSSRTLASVAPKYSPPDVRDSRVENVVIESIDNAISRIDLYAKQVSRIQGRHVNEVFEKIKADGAVSSIQSLYLIRCCGALMHDVSPAERNRFVNEMWNEFRKLGVPMDASHYNSLLKVYIENNYTFVPTDFLSSMEKNGITPNRVTYQRLIEKYCEDGNIDGASIVLEFMKQREIAVNIAIFNFLIKGHAKKGDMDGARQMMDLMDKSRLAPTIDTYLILARCSAERGDVDSVFSIIEEAKEHDIYFSTVDYLQLVYDSAVNGHTDHVNKFLERMTNLDRHRHEIANTVLDLLNKDLDEVAYKVMLFVSDKVNYDRIFNLFIRQLVKIHKPVEKVFDYCVDIKNKGFNPYILHTAAKTTLEGSNDDYTFQLFNKMQKGGVPLRTHYFWPIFATHRKNVNGIISTLKAMYDAGVPLNFDTYMDYILPNLSNQDFDSVITLIKETGHPEASAIEPLFFFYIMSCDLKNLLNLLNRHPVPAGNHRTLKLLALHYKPGNVVSLLRVLHHLSEQGAMETAYEDSQDLLGKFLMLLHDCDKLTEKALIEICQAKLMITRASADQLCLMLRKKNPDMMQYIRNLQFGTSQERYGMNKTHVRDMSIHELEEHVEELSKAGASTRAALRSLLVHYCRDRAIPKIKEILTELDEQGFRFTPSTYAVAIDAFSASGDLEEAMKLKTLLDNEFPEFKLDALKALHYAGLLVKSNKLDEAKEVIKRDCKDMAISIRVEALHSVIGRFLDTAAETKNVEFVREMHHLLMSVFSITTPMSRFLQSLIKVHLHMDNLDKAIEEYKHCILTYRQFPARNVLLKTCIDKNDNERLQQVVDLTTMYGEKFLTLHELASVFVECGHFQQAYRVIQQLGDKVNGKYLTFMCNRLYTDGKVTELEQLLNAVKNSLHVDRDELYYYLLQIYAQNNDCEKALELWNVFQEVNIQPSVKTLRLLADLLENNNQPIPFVVPIRKSELAENTSNELKPVVTDEGGLVARLTKCLSEKNVPEVTTVLREMKKGYIRLLSPNTMLEILDLHTINDCLYDLSGIVQVMSYILEKPHYIVKPLLQKYSDAGDVDLIKTLVEFLPDFTLKSLSFNYYFHKAFLKSGKFEELLSMLEENIGKNIHLFSVSGFQELLNSAPHLEERMVKLVDNYATQSKFDLPKRVLWTYYFINGKYDKAEEIFKQNLTLFTAFDPIATHIMKAIRTGQNVDLGKKYIEFLDTFEARQILKDKAYSCVLDTLVRQMALDDAVELLKTSQERAVSLRSFDPFTLIQLKKYVAEKGQTFPFAIPVGDDSSSSSDSD